MKKLIAKFNKVIPPPEQGKLSSNFINFGLLQILNYIIPLITIPYIVRVIGPEKFGIISIAQALIYYLGIISDYGYSLSGIQLISQNQENRFECSRIVKNVFTIQLIINIICFILFFAIVRLYQPYNNYFKVFIFSYFLIPANIMLASWFYIGLEKVKYISILSFISRILYVFLIFFFLRQESDFVLIPIFHSGSMILSGIISIILISNKFHINFGTFIPLNLIKFLKRDKEIFISNLFINFYRNINILILSLFANEATVGIYSAGEKIIKAIQSTFAPITQSFYPYISRISVESKKNSFKVIKYLIIVIGIFSSVIALLIYIWSDWINHLAFGNKFLDTSMVLRITSPVIMFGAVNFIIGVIFMINNNLKKEFLKSVILVGILNIIFCSFLSMKYYAIGSAVSFLMSEAFLLIIMLINIYKNKQKWVFLNEQP